MRNTTLFLLTLYLFSGNLFAQVFVGKSEYSTIQEAINGLDSNSTKKQVVFIKNGLYEEKVLITKSNFTLKGESEKGVIISFAQPREQWRCEHPDDWGAAVMNVKGHHIVFEQITVINTYGFNATGDSVFVCPNEASGKKIIRRDSHQFAFRSFEGATPLSFKNCTFRSFGGDTVSPWDVQNGDYTFKNCTMEGSVDLYCPRGNALAENCHFICHNLNAAIWHDGSGNKEAKTVLKNCTFNGVDNFKLGRFHREAQFYLINCTFPENMADADIYWVTTAPKQIEWGKRVYYKNCHRKGGDYTWHKDNQ
jgi:pectinesterase